VGDVDTAFYDDYDANDAADTNADVNPRMLMIMVMINDGIKLTYIYVCHKNI